jgi:hypothetical protein
MSFREGTGLELLKNPGVPPAVEAARDRPPGTTALRHVMPGGAGAENPEDTVEHAAVVDGRSPRRWFLWWEQRLKPFPLGVGEVYSIR